MSDLPPDSGAPEAPASQWAAFRHRPYLIYWCARAAAVFAAQIQIVAIGWQVYDLTRNPFDLGLIGLSQFLPALLLVLVTGAVADRFPRRGIMIVCLMIEAAVAFSLLAFTALGGSTVIVVFALLATFGTARAFFGPAVQSLLPNIVPPTMLANAIALNSSAWQLATILGPVAGGLLYGVSPLAAYGTATALLVTAALLATQIPKPEQKNEVEKPSLQTVLAGFRYIWSEKIVLGAISLDLFAVLLGGATALLPVFARDILDVGPIGLGLLRAGPGIGAIAVAIWLTTHSIKDHAGLYLFIFVALFGAMTVVFGLSTIPWLSIVALIILGGADMVSVYVRETLIQLWTPDRLRGRVNAVNMIFIGASNELGEFRAGTVAVWIGAKAAVVAGGAGAVLVAGLFAHLFPELRKARRLDGRP
ncbi:MFS transporter [Hyphobacterium marinum]|uniref:MFS transporter n=1 Tax=Hyphobacterium marinum TaxID=3116574 RepID=A0ABU7LZI6_9PROT|nr:MFS transporter [Hyphobacterium sp. Y6023]MEE2566945.1 MFS transporter [Hyphobacterium sp. Y6023]